MAAVIKKRALAEYTQVVQEEVTVPKKLRLTHKVKSQEPPLSFEGATTSQQVLEILLRFEDQFPIDTSSANQAIRLLQDKFCSTKEAVVRAKIASIFALLARIPNIETQGVVNGITRLLKTEESHKVQSQLIGALCACGQVALLDRDLHQQVLQLATQYLTSASHAVRIKCICTLGALGRPEFAEAQAVLARFVDDPDSRVRAAALEALLTWHGRGLRLQQELYERVSAALQDDYEAVRRGATKLIWVLSQLFPDGKVKYSKETDDENRLIDDGFAKICDMMNDSSVRVRAEAAGLLGSLHGVSQKFLEQTLDKKLMSNMRRKMAAHERNKENFESGGWSSGKKWADDKPGEDIDEEAVTVMAMGACGAFVHGLEDEFMEVRNASIDSVGELAMRSESFAVQCQDHLVDMFNDELEAVRMNAINSVRKLGKYVVLREDQSENILACLKDYSGEIRDALRLLFCTVKLGTQACLHDIIFGLLDNLKRYPQDRTDIYKTMQLLGKNQPFFTLPLVPDLLSSHPYFESIEADVNDPAYVAILVLVFNAAHGCPSIVPLFPAHVLKHYTYLRDTLPDRIPVISLEELPQVPSTRIEENGSRKSSNPASFMQDTLVRLQAISSMDHAAAAQLMSMCVGDLSRVAQLDAKLSPNAGFLSTFLECHLALCKVLSKGKSQLAQTNSFALLKKLVDCTHCLEQQYIGLAVKDTCDVIQLRLLAQSMQLLQLITANVTGMKQSCVQYLQILNSFERFLTSNKMESESVAKALLGEMNKLESCDPAVFYTVITEAVKEYKPSVLCLSNNLQKARATIIEPTGDTDKVIKFISGLVVSVDLIANLENVECTRDIRIRVKYADQEIHSIMPRAADFKQLSEDKHRLTTKVLLSHNQWSEPCQVEISIVKSYIRDREFSQEKSLVKMDRKIESFVELCSPVCVNVAPRSGKY